jgi:hypothetical protein
VQNRRVVDGASPFVALAWEGGPHRRFFARPGPHAVGGVGGGRAPGAEAPRHGGAVRALLAPARDGLAARTLVRHLPMRARVLDGAVAGATLGLAAAFRVSTAPAQ